MRRSEKKCNQHFAFDLCFFAPGWCCHCFRRSFVHWFYSFLSVSILIWRVYNCSVFCVSSRSNFFFSVWLVWKFIHINVRFRIRLVFLVHFSFPSKRAKKISLDFGMITYTHNIVWCVWWWFKHQNWVQMRHAVQCGQALYLLKLMSYYTNSAISICEV